jgi:1,4-dihydroxy-2-naphthoate octaprenyltransferase
MFIHQLYDLNNDKKAGIDTFTTIQGYGFAMKLQQRLFFPLEVLFLVFLLIIAVPLYPTMSIVIVVYLAWVIFMTSMIGRKYLAFTWDKFDRPALADLYEVFLPLTLALLAAAKNPMNVLIVLVLIPWQWKRLSNLYYRARRALSKRISRREA